MIAIALVSFPLVTSAAPTHKSVEGDVNVDVAEAGVALIYTTVQSFKTNSGGPNHENVQIYFHNAGTTTIDTLVMKLDTHNFVFDTIEPRNSGGEATTTSFDRTTGEWKGTLGTNQRIHLHAYGTVADKPGEQYSITATVLEASSQSSVLAFAPESSLSETSTKDILYNAVDLKLTSSITTPGKIVKDDVVDVQVTIENLGPDSGWDTELAGFFVYVFPPTNFQYTSYSSSVLTCTDEDLLKDYLDQDYWDLAAGRHGLLCVTKNNVSIQIPLAHGEKMTLDFTGVATSDFTIGDDFRSLLFPSKMGDPSNDAILDAFDSDGDVFALNNNNNISFATYQLNNTTTTTQPTVTTTEPPLSVTTTTPMDVDVRGVSATQLPVTGYAIYSHLYTAAFVIAMGSAALFATRRKKSIIG